MDLLVVSLVALLAAAAPDPGTIAVPRGRAPVIDGVVRADEWKGAVTRPLEGGGRAHFLHDGTDLHVGLADLPGKGWGYGALLLGDADTVLVLHASAQVGSAVYVVRSDPGARRWRPLASEYAWKNADRLYAEEGWMADVARHDGGKGREFRIALRTLGARRLGLVYIVETRNEETAMLRLPKGLAIDRRVPDGWNPDSVSIAPETWPRVTWK